MFNDCSFNYEPRFILDLKKGKNLHLLCNALKINIKNLASNYKKSKNSLFYY